MRLVLALAALAIGGTAIAAPKPFVAVYDVSRDGKVIGETQVQLADAGRGEWTLTTSTKGTAGMARMLGLDVSESSRFRWKDGVAEGISYDYRQDATLKHKQRHAEFDWSAGQAHVSDGDKKYDYPIQPGTMDRHMVSLVLGDAIASGRKDAALAVAAKDHVEQQQYTDSGKESVKVPAGIFQATRVERTDSPGKVRSWYAPERALIPVKLEQVQGDKSTIVLELKSVS